MSTEPLREQFAKNPLAYLDASFNGVSPVRIGADEFCVGEPLAARQVLLNAADLYEETADVASFFTDQRFAKRPQQVELRTHVRTLFRRHIDASTGEALANAVAANIPASSEWPDTGNWFFIQFFRFVLLHQDSNPRLFPLIDDIIRTSSLAGARDRHASWKRRLLALKRMWLLTGEINYRRHHPPSAPRDLLDSIILVSEPDQLAMELIDVMSAFVTSVSSTGFVLGWVLYLIATEGDPGPSIPSGCIVLEALRLWPTSWMVGRSARRPHEVAGTHINRGDVVIACPYLVNRHVDYWPEATKFMPERWLDPKSRKNPAFLTFGHGVHRCALADYATEILSLTVDVLRSRGFSIVPKGTARPLGPFIYPPAFTLRLRNV